MSAEQADTRSISVHSFIHSFIGRCLLWALRNGDAPEMIPAPLKAQLPVGVISKGVSSILEHGAPLTPHLPLHCPRTMGLNIPLSLHLTPTTELFPRPVPPTALSAPSRGSGQKPGVTVNPSLTVHVTATRAAPPSKYTPNPGTVHRLHHCRPGPGHHQLLPGCRLSLLACPLCHGPYITASSSPQLPSVQAPLPQGLCTSCYRCLGGSCPLLPPLSPAVHSPLPSDHHSDITSSGRPSLNSET